VHGSCAFAVRQPAITTGIIGAVVAGGTCELTTHNSGGGASGDELACGITTGAVGLGLGLVVAAAIWLGGDGHTILVEEPMTEPPPPIHSFKPIAVEPTVVDAGVSDAPPADAS